MYQAAQPCPLPLLSVLDDATVKCWGKNEFGTLGVGDTTSRGNMAGQMGDNLLAVNLTFGRGHGQVANVFAGTFHTCVSGTQGGIACFGINEAGQVKQSVQIENASVDRWLYHPWQISFSEVYIYTG